MSLPRKGEATLHPDECWKLLERAAASSQLRRAARSREFLYYVGTRVLKEGCTEIHEQELGHAVFGRPENYDTSQDNIVRVSATELRKRLEGYFTTEGASEPLVVEIPRGSYLPVFRARPEAVALARIEEIPANPVNDISGKFYRQLPLLVVSAIALLLAIGCTLLWRQNHLVIGTHSTLDNRPALAAFWSKFLGSPRQTDIVLADTSYALVEDMARKPFTLSDYVDGTYMNWIQSSTMSADRKADLEVIMKRNNGSLGDFRVAQRIFQIDPGSSKFDLAYAREYSADSITRDNVILIGSQKSNPWVDLFYSRLAFTIEFDPALTQLYIKNRDPQPGELPTYTVTGSPEDPVGYGIVAYMPNPSNTADALIIAGTNSQATDAAGEFVASENSMERLQQKFPQKRVPYFEALLKTTRLRSTPIDAEIVAYRTF